MRFYREIVPFVGPTKVCILGPCHLGLPATMTVASVTSGPVRASVGGILFSRW